MWATAEMKHTDEQVVKKYADLVMFFFRKIRWLKTELHYTKVNIIALEVTDF